jgi:hypothetical protein
MCVYIYIIYIHTNTNNVSLYYVMYVVCVYIYLIYIHTQILSSCRLLLSDPHNIHTHIHTYMHAYTGIVILLGVSRTCVHTYTHTHMYMHAYTKILVLLSAQTIITNIDTYMYACMHIQGLSSCWVPSPDPLRLSSHTYIHTYIHTCIHTYIHRDCHPAGCHLLTLSGYHHIHTYMHTYTGIVILLGAISWPSQAIITYIHTCIHTQGLSSCWVPSPDPLRLSSHTYIHAYIHRDCHPAGCHLLTLWDRQLAMHVHIYSRSLTKRSGICMCVCVGVYTCMNSWILGMYISTAAA